MALVNTAVALAQRGRRVLVVDFDIEAPGLDTFEVLRPQKEIPGIVDFVAGYLASGKAPDVTDYIGNCPDIGAQGGQLWIMPSGRSDRYAMNLGQIDWAELYEKRDGYVLFEDLKEQWLRVVRPDYILIDSRTGHTDSGGICTRQLPDAVVILFFPNEQNLRGLVQIVGDIRRESAEPRKKNIALHFVMSNVPDLDDEDMILENQISAFQEQLGFRRDPMVVHRYDSLSLLNQVVFTKDRPRSRLANEYGQIVREISTRNWNDRDGALEYIKRAGERNRWLEDDSILTRDERLTRIEEAHRDDGEILFRLAQVKEHDRHIETAGLLVGQAIELGYDHPEAHLKRSRFRADNGDSTGAAEDAWHVLDSGQIAPPMAREAIGLLIRLGIREPRKFAESSAVNSLEPSGKHWLASTFNYSRNDLSIAVVLWEKIAASPNSEPGVRRTAKHNLGLSYMGLGRCAEAVAILHEAIHDVTELRIDDAFNFSMAMWGLNGTIDGTIFERVVEIDRSSKMSRETANYLQCMAIALWAIGETGEAKNRLNQAQRAMNSLRRRTEFSCWRYLEVTKGVFEADLEEIRAMIEENEARVPRFVVSPDTANLTAH